nr:GBF-interacting protein 1-like isoform X1 [Tanacetum cinerariifolium]
MPQGQKKNESLVASSFRDVPDGSSGKKQSEASASTASSKLEGPLPQISAIEANGGIVNKTVGGITVTPKMIKVCMSGESGGDVKKTIQNIKEITGNNYSEDEIYSMLKECSMDPNQTTHNLLSMDPFHEVKRKRDRKKENVNKESIEPRQKPGMQGRGNRGGRGNYSARHISNGGGRNSLPAKENGINQGVEDGPNQSMPQGQKKNESLVASSFRDVPDGSSGKKQSEASASTASSKLEGPLPQISAIEASKGPIVAVVFGSSHGSLSNNVSASKTPPASPGVFLSDSDPILMPSQDSRAPVGTIRREVWSQKTPIEQIHENPLEIKSTACESNSSMQGKASGELQGVGKNINSDSSRPGSSSRVSFSTGRPSSNHNNRTQQGIGPQKVGPSMEWKPKAVNPVLAQGTGLGESVKVPAVPVEDHTSTLSASNNLGSQDTARELEKKLEESHISDVQHVIIPDHLHVPEAEKLGFCFGSFDPSFGFNASSSNGPVSDVSSEASEVVDESIEEQPRNQNELASADEGDQPDRPTSSSNMPESLSVDGDVSSNVAPEYQESKQETSLPTAGHQYPVHTSPNFSFGFMSPMIGNQLSSFESNESQGRDGFHVPSLVVPQPFDPASYYAQFYHSGADGDGRMSPFHSTGPTEFNGYLDPASYYAQFYHSGADGDGRMSPFHSTGPTEFNGYVPMLSSQEVGNSLMLSAAGPTPVASQTGGVTQGSIAVTQQPLPVFRQPTGVHLSHYPPNFMPYGPYFSPYYVHPPPIHQFLNNGTFPQQPQGGSMYQVPPLASPKYPLPQYKPGGNAGNSGHIGMPAGYGPYGSTPAGYNPGSATTAGNSTSSEDFGGPQFKESNAYMTGQQEWQNERVRQAGQWVKTGTVSG